MKAFIIGQMDYLPRGFDNIEKIPGRQIIRLMKIPNDVKNIYVIGNLSNKNKSYLEENLIGKVLHQQSIMES